VSLAETGAVETASEPALATVETERPTVRRMVADAWRWRRLIPRLGIRVTIKGVGGTILGPGWMILRPAIGIFGMSLLFGRVLNTPSQGLPYLIFMLVGAHAWMLFERPAHWGVRSFDVYRRVVRNLYMPLILVPLAAIVPALLESCVIGTFAAATLLYFWIADGTLYLQLGPELLVAVAGYVMALGLALAISLWLSVLNAYARDVRITFIYILRIWIFVTPVIYPVSQLPSGFQPIAYLNPMTAPVEMVKWGLLGVGSVPLHAIVSSVASLVILGVGGAWFFTRLAPNVLNRQPADLDDEDF
jgi:lipopolysaccharide transport system permease protein